VKSFSLTVFSSEERELLARAEEIVRRLPEVEDPDDLRCHEVARIVGGVLGLEVTDGHYGFVEHSWCWTTPLSKAQRVGIRIGMPNILDPYCVGSLPQVRLIDGQTTALPHVGWAYRPGETRTDIDNKIVEYWIHHLDGM
jgi:hypothetical protein